MPSRLPPPSAVVVFFALAVLAAGAASATPPTINGHVQYETFGYPDPDTTGERWENFFAATLRAHGEISPELTWQFEGRAVADDVAFTAGGYSLRNATRRRPYLSLITAVLDYRPSENLRVSVGNQVVSWSIFDELQPANLMSPRDESDPFRRIDQGVPSVAAHYGSGGAFAELVVVPLAFTPSRLPQGRWDIIRNENVIRPQDQPPVQLDETQAGARIGAHLGQLEATVIGYVGRDTEAVFVPGPLVLVGFKNGRPQFKAQIIDRYPQLRAGGVTASYPFGDRVIMRVESVYYNSPDRFRDDLLQSVAGVEYALDDWRIVASYLRDDQIIAAPEEVTNKGERQFFQSFIFGEIRYDAGGRLRGRLRGGYDATGDFSLLQSELSYRVWQTVWISLLGEQVDAGKRSYEDNKTSYFDTISHEDRLGTRIEYDF
ncbi:MAG TPA: hypothetical protein VMW17_12245 [Candidatus Binatia bacterium]|nr:hypothetical protein [Candidatus Binatia bacterium]